MSSISQESATILKQCFSKEDIVIVAPLNWGLGHATRCIPIINYLSQYCQKVIIASDGQALELLRSEFPNHQCLELPGYGIKYRFGHMIFDMICNLPSICYGIYRESSIIGNMVTSTNANVILSDNRMGFRGKKVKNYYLTHQINIHHQNKWISFLGSFLHQYWIKKFDLCLIPDYEDQRSLCPDLTLSNPTSKKYLGPLTRVKNTYDQITWDICVILSGPEPQRSILEKAILEHLVILSDYKIVFVRGSYLKLHISNIPLHIKMVDVANSSEIEKVLNTSKLLIARSGYSTIMDIDHLDIKAVFIPTPGQPEQEYLAQRCITNPKYSVLSQNEIIKLQKTIISLI